MECKLYVRGDLDLSSVGDLIDEFDRALSSDAEVVLVDCADMTFIDSIGIHALLDAHEALAAQQRSMQIVNVIRSQRRVFDIVGLADLLLADVVSN